MLKQQQLETQRGPWSWPVYARERTLPPRPVARPYRMQFTALLSNVHQRMKAHHAERVTERPCSDLANRKQRSDAALQRPFVPLWQHFSPLQQRPVPGTNAMTTGHGHAPWPSQRLESNL